MKLKVTLINNANYEVDVPEGFNFTAWHNSLKLFAGWHMDKLFVPYHAIAAAQIVDANENQLSPPKGVDFSGGMVKQ